MYDDCGVYFRFAMFFELFWQHGSVDGNVDLLVN